MLLFPAVVLCQYLDFAQNIQNMEINEEGRFEDLSEIIEEYKGKNLVLDWLNDLNFPLI